MIIELTTCNGKKLLVNLDYLQTAREADNGHSYLEIDGYDHSVEVIQNIETIKRILLYENN